MERLEAQQEELAALKLQAVTRGHLERKMVKAKQAQVKANKAGRANKLEQEITAAAGGQADEWVRVCLQDAYWVCC
jgi:hypothetical protein